MKSSVSHPLFRHPKWKVLKLFWFEILIRYCVTMLKVIQPWSSTSLPNQVSLVSLIPPNLNYGSICHECDTPIPHEFEYISADISASWPHLTCCKILCYALYKLPTKPPPQIYCLIINYTITVIEMSVYHKSAKLISAASSLPQLRLSGNHTILSWPGDTRTKWGIFPSTRQSAQPYRATNYYTMLHYTTTFNSQSHPPLCPL